MMVRDPRGQTFEAQLSTAHSASSYGMPVLVVAGLLALGPADCRGWQLAESSEDERRELREYGYTIGGAS